jgi:hypothetical protein
MNKSVPHACKIKTYEIQSNKMRYRGEHNANEFAAAAKNNKHD